MESINSKENITELCYLAERFGKPEQIQNKIISNRLFGPVNRTDRRGEVVFALMRPQHRILLSTKSFYPNDLYRLPTGGIGNDEKVLDALYREVEEETSLNAEIIRFLAILDTHIITPNESMNFKSYVFLLNAIDGVPKSQDESEEITGFKEVHPLELLNIAQRLRNLPKPWKGWGEFRAIAHEVVGRILLRESSV